MQTLYELTEEMKELLEMLDQAENLDDIEVIIDTKDEVEEEFNKKIEGYAKAVKSLEAHKQNLESEYKRLKERCDKEQKKIEKIKSAMMASMDVLGITKSGGDVFSVNIKGNGGVAPLLVMVDPKDIPDEYRKISYSADNKAIRKALEDGVELDWACFADRGVSLVIK